MTAPDEPLWDPAGQNERTMLSWNRTALAVLVGLIGAMRATAETSPSMMIPLAGAALLAVAVMAWVGLRRYRRTQAALRTGRLPTDGLQPLLLSVSTMLLGAFAVAYLVLG